MPKPTSQTGDELTFTFLLTSRHEHDYEKAHAVLLDYGLTRHADGMALGLVDADLEGLDERQINRTLIEEIEGTLGEGTIKNADTKLGRQDVVESVSAEGRFKH